MKKLVCFIIGFIYLGSVVFRCSDPLSKNKEAIVRILLDEPLERARYKVFWDGKNDKEQYVTPGTYWAILYTSEFDDQLSMLVQEGGITEANYEGEVTEYGSFGFLELVSIEPDTFKVKEGTNITFIIDDQAAGKTVRLDIRNKK